MKLTPFLILTLSAAAQQPSVFRPNQRLWLFSIKISEKPRGGFMRSGACRDSFCTIRLTCGRVLSIVLGGILNGGGFGGATGSLFATDRRFASQLPNSGLVDKKQRRRCGSIGAPSREQSRSWASHGNRCR